MKPPRYMAREYVLLRHLKSQTPGKFLEIGYGSGDFLKTALAQGFKGDAYDPSETALQVASRLGLDKVQFLQSLPAQGAYDFIFFFEVLGYFDDPIGHLRHMHRLLKPNGKIIFSFTRQGSGYSLSATGNMKCFSRAEVESMLTASGFKVAAFENYGFPLINLLRPLHTMSFLLSSRQSKTSTTVDVHDTGIRPQSLIVKLGVFLVSKVIIWPFLLIQRLFKHTDLGNGYVVVASR